jgi:hypothetical protein
MGFHSFDDQRMLVFDSRTGEVYITDTGNSRIEEFSIAPMKYNYNLRTSQTQKFSGTVLHFRVT